jgi:TDG/mug DNA glycosylase family protein
MPDDRVYSFPPVVGPGPRLLILGSMPSVASLAVGQYYGNPRNHFWHLMADVLAEPGVPADYGERLAMLTRHGVALWDALASCVRPGSLDGDIRDERPNDVGGLLRVQPTIETVACNGRAAELAFRRHVPNAGVRVILLPSSSPVPTRAMRTYADRLAAWAVLKQVLADAFTPPEAARPPLPG